MKRALLALTLALGCTGLAGAQQQIPSKVDISFNRFADVQGINDQMFRLAEAYPELKADGQFLALQRELSLTEDRVILEVREALRSLRSSESSLKIQEQIVASEEKNVKIARLRFERGEIGNRDLTDALTNLVDAKDRYVRDQGTGLVYVVDDQAIKPFTSKTKLRDTAISIIVLLVIMLCLNAVAIIIRNRYQKRW